MLLNYCIVAGLHKFFSKTKIRHLDKGLYSLRGLRVVPACKSSHSPYPWQEEFVAFPLTYDWCPVSR